MELRGEEFCRDRSYLGTLSEKSKLENETEIIEESQEITILREREEILSNSDRNVRWYRNLSL